MPITSLRIQNIRNLSEIAFEPASRINIVHGANGSGKTSLLEAIHFLGLTRSFRTHQFRYLVSSEHKSSLVFAEVQSRVDTKPQPLGVTRAVDGAVNIRYAGQTMELPDLASLLPLQVINTDTFDLLEGSPSIRRQFIDWGAFHADARFIHVWRGFKRALQQRNSLLKCGKIDRTLRQIWDKELVQYAEPLTNLRQQYIEQLIPDFEAILSRLNADLDVRLKFSPGWDQSIPLDELLEANFERDLKQGFTGSGPQRADLRVKADGVSAAERLSRGQKKLVVSALKLAQGNVFHRMSERPCIYLIDDLPSELDEAHCRFFCEFLENTHNQCFITCVDPAALLPYWKEDTELACFELSQGQLIETD